MNTSMRIYPGAFQPILLALALSILLGCHSPCKNIHTTPQKNCFDVMISEVNLTNGTMAQAVAVVNDAWANSLDGETPVIVWSELPNTRISMTAKEISVGRFLSILAGLSLCTLEVRKTGIVFSPYPAVLTDDYTPQILSVSPVLYDLLQMGKRTKCKDIQDALEQFGIRVSVLFVDPDLKLILVKGLKCQVEALKGMQALLENGVTVKGVKRVQP